MGLNPWPFYSRHLFVYCCPVNRAQARQPIGWGGGGGGGGGGSIKQYIWKILNVKRNTHD